MLFLQPELFGFGLKTVPYTILKFYPNKERAKKVKSMSIQSVSDKALAELNETSFSSQNLHIKNQ